jgi:D-lactate dehydrogenase
VTNRAPTTPANDFYQRLKAVAGKDNLLLDEAVRQTYGHDNSRFHSTPDAVVLATSVQQLGEIVRLCNEYKVALVARGRGTGTTGATVPLHGGVVLSMERMNRILKIDPANRVMVVEPGVTNQAIQDAAGEHGFFWAPDPSSASFCTVGGNLAYNSAGPRAVKYGTPRENTLGLRAITGAGKEIRTGVYTTKGVVGYDLTRLIIGSEGTLAIITEATLKLTPLETGKRTLQAIYSNMHQAAQAVSRIMAQPVIPCALEFIDGKAIDMIRDYSKVEFPQDAGAMLMIEVDGDEGYIDRSVAAVQEAADGIGLLSFSIATSEAEIQQLWQTRKALSPALRTIAPKKINEDVVVPVSRIPELIEGLDALSTQYHIPIVNFGHAGNGNIHVNMLINPDDPQQMDNAEECLGQMFDLVLKLNGTLSGEHGVGIEKRDYISREIDATSLELMRAIKQQFDPKGILNPNKMFPTTNTANSDNTD